ncbi:MAG: ABC transporter permease [Candidatus Limnocylindria bacterium]
MSLVRPAFLIAAKDLRQRLRDRSALIVAFAAPLVIATIVSFALGGSGSFRATFAVVDLDKGDVTRGFLDGLRNAPGLREAVTLKEVADVAEARRLIAVGQAGAAIVFPSGLSAAAQAGTGARIEVLRSVESRIGAEVAEAITRSFAADFDATRLSIGTAIASGAAGVPPDPVRIRAISADAAAASTPLRLVDGNAGGREVKPASYFGPSMAIFFLFFTVQYGAIGILNERRSGTLQRLLAAPIRRESIILGKSLGTFLLGLTSLGTMIVATTLLLGASWGDPVAVAAIAVSIVLAAMGVTALAASQARTAGQAEGLASIVTMGMALLGGNFVPLQSAPEAMRTLALATPNGLALRALGDLVADGGGIMTVLPYLAGILAFAVICGGIAVFRARQAVGG